MNILKADAFANRRGMILDSFVFDDPHRNFELESLGKGSFSGDFTPGHCRQAGSKPVDCRPPRKPGSKKI